MVQKFSELKKKYAIIAIIKSLIASVFAALFAVGAVMLGVKLGGAYLAWYFYLLIGLGAFAVAFGVAFLCTYRSDKALARELDNEYGLKERVQTMVEFSGQEGDLLKLQREDTAHTLENLPKKRISIAKIWQYVVVAVLGLSFFLSGLLVASSYVPPIDGDKFVLDAWDEKALEQLIEDVRSSELEERVKVPAVAALELLKDELSENLSKTVMQQKVKSCAEAIDTAVIVANTYRDVAYAMDEYSALNAFKTSLVNASECYVGDTQIDSMNRVKAESKQAESKIRSSLTVFSDAFYATVKNATDVLAVKTAIDAVLEPFNESLSTDEAVAKLEEGDDLFVALSSFSIALGDVSDSCGKPTGYSLEYSKELVQKACTDYVSAMSEELVVQVYNCMMDEMICATLKSLFGVNVSPTSLVLSGALEGGSGSGDDTSHSGGAGDEKVEYAADDAIYDHNKAENVAYGEVWNDYRSKLYEKLNDKDSELSDEMKAYIRNYINILSSTADDSTEEGN